MGPLYSVEGLPIIKPDSCGYILCSSFIHPFCVIEPTQWGCTTLILKNMNPLTPLICTGGRTRTATSITTQGILSPSCLPFHHTGQCFTPSCQRTFLSLFYYVKIRNKFDSHKLYFQTLQSFFCGGRWTRTTEP